MFMPYNPSPKRTPNPTIFWEYLKLCFCTSCSGRASLQKAWEEKNKYKKANRNPFPPSCKYFIPYKKPGRNSKCNKPHTAEG